MKKIKENNYAFIFKIFFAIGLILLIVGGGLLIKHTIDKKNSIAVEAKITNITQTRESDGDLKHNVYVSYEYDNKVYTDIRINSYNITMEVFDTITIYIVKDNPEKVISKGDVIPMVVMIGIGTMFSFLGGILTIKLSVKTRKQKKVKKTGDKIKCYISEILPDTSYMVNGRYVNSIITCRPVEKNNSAEYKSNSHKTSNLLQVNNIIYVYVDKQDPDNYYVDLNSGSGVIYLEDANLEKQADSKEIRQCEYCGSISNEDKCPNCKANLKK